MSRWIPGTFLERGRAAGYNPVYLQKLHRKGLEYVSKGVPPIFSLGHIAAIIGLPYDVVQGLIRRTIDPYRVFHIAKRAGGYRLIAVPTPPLLRFQRWIHSEILSRRPVHPSATAYSRGTSPKLNALLHCNSSWVIKLDVLQFFESISERQVFHVFRDAGYDPLIAFYLTRLCTRVGSGRKKYQSRRWFVRETRSRVGNLPQGAPTSPALSNLVCKLLDTQVSEAAASMGCIYSRYADDMTFSSSQFSREKSIELIKVVSELLSKWGFRRNHKKNRILPPGSRRIVSGLLVDTPRPRLAKEFRERIRAHLYYCRKFGIHEHCVRRGFRSLPGFQAHLRGLIQYAESVDPSIAQTFRAEFMALDWPPTQ